MHLIVFIYLSFLKSLLKEMFIGFLMFFLRHIWSYDYDNQHLVQKMIYVRWYGYLKVREIYFVM